MPARQKAHRAGLWKLATGAKVLVVLGIFVLVVPGTCFGITALAETLGLLAPIDLK